MIYHQVNEIRIYCGSRNNILLMSMSHSDDRIMLFSGINRKTTLSSSPVETIGTSSQSENEACYRENTSKHDEHVTPFFRRFLIKTELVNTRSQTKIRMTILIEFTVGVRKDTIMGTMKPVDSPTVFLIPCKVPEYSGATSIRA